MTFIQGTTALIHQSLSEYAATHYAPGSEKPLSERTVKRWLADDELPGAFKDEQGRWRIPHTAERQPHANAQVVATPGHTHEVAGTVAVGKPDLDQFPTMLTLQHAELLLGVPWRTIAAHRDYFDVVELDRLRVPLATVKRLRGLTG